MKVREFGPKLLPQNQLDIYLLTVREYWLGTAKSKNFFRSILLQSYEILKISYLTQSSTDRLTDRPTDRPTDRLTD